MNTLTSLGQLACGAAAAVHSVDASSPVGQRLLALGFLPGVPLRVASIAPLGDPMLVELANARISLRRHDAAHIHVQPITNP